MVHENKFRRKIWKKSEICFFLSRNSQSKHERNFQFFRERFRSMETLVQVE